VLTDAIADQSTASGILLPIDKVHADDRAELREVCTVVQHCFPEQRPVMLAAARLPAAVQDLLLKDKALTFLRRASRRTLGSVDADDAAEALEQPIPPADAPSDPTRSRSRSPAAAATHT
jgi:hypothetical protein